MFHNWLVRATVGLAFGFAAVSLPASPGQAQGMAGPPGASSVADESLGALFGAPVGTEELAGLRARGSDPIATTLNQAGFSGNTATGATSGDAAMNGSVSSNSGFTTVFQNTGNNVLFQNSTTVNITLR